MNQTHQENTKKTEKQFVDILHESLINHRVITDPRVIQCGTYYSKERGYFRYRIKCGNIKECPRCREELDSKTQMLQDKRNVSIRVDLFSSLLEPWNTRELIPWGSFRTNWLRLSRNSRTRRVGGNSETNNPSHKDCIWDYLLRGKWVSPSCPHDVPCNNQIITQTELESHWMILENLYRWKFRCNESGWTYSYVGGKSYYPESLDDLFKQQKDVMKKNFAKKN